MTALVQRDTIARYFNPDTPQFALIRFEVHGANAVILAVGSEPSVMALHAETPHGGGVFYSVRPVDHELTLNAADQMAARLTENQRQVLADLETDRRRYGRRHVRPGYQMRGPAPWRGMYSGDLLAHARSPKMTDFVRVSGVAYGPKTYSLTRLGRVVAGAILDRTERKP